MQNTLSDAGSITYPLLDVRGWLSNICTACGHVGNDAQSTQIQAIRQRAKAKTDTFMAWSKRELRLVPHFFFPPSYRVKVRYIKLTWRCIFWCLSRPLRVLSYQSLENGKRMWLLWKDEDNEWQQAVEMAWLLPGSVCLGIGMVAEPGEPWSRVQVNKQRTVGCIMISERWGVCLLRWGFCRGGWTEEWLLLFKGGDGGGDSGDVIACFSFCFFFLERSLERNEKLVTNRKPQLDKERKTNRLLRETWNSSV